MKIFEFNSPEEMSSGAVARLVDGDGNPVDEDGNIIDEEINIRIQKFVDSIVRHATKLRT